MASRQLRLVKLLKNPFPDVDLTEPQLKAARLIAFGYSVAEVAEMEDVGRQAIYERLRKAEAKIGKPQSQFTKELIKAIAALVI